LVTPTPPEILAPLRRFRLRRPPKLSHDCAHSWTVWEHIDSSSAVCLAEGDSHHGYVSGHPKTME
jgi:hypothetical protein